MKPAVIDAVSAYKNWPGFDIRLGLHVSNAYLGVEAEEFERSDLIGKEPKSKQREQFGFPVCCSSLIK